MSYMLFKQPRLRTRHVADKTEGLRGRVEHAAAFTALMTAAVQSEDFWLNATNLKKKKLELQNYQIYKGRQIG